MAVALLGDSTATFNGVCSVIGQQSNNEIQILPAISVIGLLAFSSTLWCLIVEQRIIIIII